MALAAALRLGGDLAGNPGWYTDEGTHLDLVRHQLQGQVQYLAVGDSLLLFGRLPLFAWLLAGASRLAGLDITTLRALTAGLGALTVAALGLGLAFGQRRRPGGASALAWLAAGALALAPSAVLYSRFGFSYNLLAPLVVIVLVGLWGYGETRSRRWLAVAAAAVGLGLVSDLWAGVLLAPLAVIVLLRRPADLAWSLALAGAPFALYAAFQWSTAPAAFAFDLNYTLARLNRIPLEQQLATLADNVVQVARQEPWLALGGLGLFALRPAALRRAAGLLYGLPVLALGRTVALYSLSTYYLIPLFPLAALGLGALIERGWDWAARWRPARAALGVGALSAAVVALAVTVAQLRQGFTTPLDPFLVRAAEARAAADFVNAHSGADDLTLASPAVAWLLRGQVADFQMAAAAAGRATPHLPADLPAERFVFDPGFARARFVIVDDLWRNWAAVHVPEVDARLRDMDNWPTVFRAGAVVVAANPVRSP